MCIASARAVESFAGAVRDDELRDPHAGGASAAWRIAWLLASASSRTPGWAGTTRDVRPVDGEASRPSAASRRGAPRLAEPVVGRGAADLQRRARRRREAGAAARAGSGGTTQRVWPSTSCTGAESATRACAAARASAAARTRGCCVRSGSATRACRAVERGERVDEHAGGGGAVEPTPARAGTTTKFEPWRTSAASRGGRSTRFAIRPSSYWSEPFRTRRRRRHVGAEERARRGA